LYPGLAGRLLSEEPLGFDAGNSPPNFTDPTGLRQAGNPLASLPSVSRPFANLASLASTPSRSVSAPPTVPAAVPSSRYVSTPTLSHEQVAAQLSASNARINDIFVQNGLIAPRHVTKVTPVRIPGGGEEFRKVANSIADSYYSGVTGTNDILSPYFYTDAANQLAGGIVQGFGSVVGALGDTALPGYTNTLIEYSDNKNPRIIPGSPTSGELAGSALVFADPLFAGSSRPAGQLALRSAGETGIVAPSNTGLVRGSNPSRVTFQGTEVRAVRDLSHLDESTLRTMQQRGFAARDINGEPLQLHHLNQNPAGPLVEIPATRHSITNPVQHPLGNVPGAGLTSEQRAAFNQYRPEYWKARATVELQRRGVQ
jgi:hypothetical protein